MTLTLRFSDHAQFQKKIREYIRLADVQAQRGFIDKAIDVNNSATKFCKDRDNECKIELETQLKRLIELKLKESIERIEKGNNSTKIGEEDNSANINALRQAMGGGSGARSQKAQKVVKKDGDTAAKDTPKKQTATRTSKYAPRSVDDMRRDIEKQVQQKTNTGTPQQKVIVPRPSSGLSTTKSKTKANGTATKTKSVSASQRVPDTLPKSFTKIFHDDLPFDSDEISNNSADNVRLRF